MTWLACNTPDCSVPALVSIHTAWPASQSNHPGQRLPPQADSHRLFSEPWKPTPAPAPSGSSGLRSHKINTDSLYWLLDCHMKAIRTVWGRDISHISIIEWKKGMCFGKMFSASIGADLESQLDNCQDETQIIIICSWLVNKGNKILWCDVITMWLQFHLQHEECSPYQLSFNTVHQLLSPSKIWEHKWLLDHALLLTCLFIHITG